MGNALIGKFVSLILICFISPLFKVQAQADTGTKNIVYAEVGNRKLLLDIYLPPAEKNPYLVVWIHGGAWHSGSKEEPPLELLSSGYAIASVDFRVSTEAIFPAPIHDIKAAIRFLRGTLKNMAFVRIK